MPTSRFCLEASAEHAPTAFPHRREKAAVGVPWRSARAEEVAPRTSVWPAIRGARPAPHHLELAFTLAVKACAISSFSASSRLQVGVNRAAGLSRRDALARIAACLTRSSSTDCGVWRRFRSGYIACQAEHGVKPRAVELAGQALDALRRAGDLHRSAFDSPLRTSAASATRTVAQRVLECVQPPGVAHLGAKCERLPPAPAVKSARPFRCASAPVISASNWLPSSCTSSPRRNTSSLL